MKFADQIDGITLEQLRASGATKWSAQDGTIGAFVAEMDFGIAPEIVEALHGAVDEGAFGYLPVGHTAELGAVTSRMLGERYGWDVGPGDVWPVPDVIKAMELAIKHHSAPNGKVIVLTPAYMPFLLIPPMLGKEIIQLPMLEEQGRYHFDFDGLVQAFEDGGNLLILCNPYNPGGRVFTREELAAVGEIVERYQGRVFADEIWAPLVYAEARHIPYASVNEVNAGHSITAISASKAWNLPGLKCAQVITSNEADRQIWQKIGFFAGHGTSNLGVVANIAAYRSGFPWLQDVLDYLDGNRKLLKELVAEKLPGVRYHEPEGTYIAWLDFRGTSIPESPATFLKNEAGIHLTEGVSCGQDFDGFVRLIFATPRPILERIIESMAVVMPQK